MVRVRSIRGAEGGPYVYRQSIKNEPLPVFDKGQQPLISFTYPIRRGRPSWLRKQAEGETVEIGTGDGQVIDLAKLVIRLAKSKSRISYQPMRKGEDKDAHVVADVRLLKRFTDFRSEVDFETGMRNAVDYYKDLLRT